MPSTASIPSNPGILGTIWAGTMNHRCRYLAYDFYQMRTYHLADDGDISWLSTHIRINGVSVLHRRVGRPTTAAAGEDFAQTTANDAGWSGMLDLDTYPGTLTPGTDYLLTVTSDWSVDYNETLWETPTVRVSYLYEVPDAGQVVAGWTNFETWQHGHYAMGDSNPSVPARRITASVDNLEILGAAAPRYINPVARQAADGVGMAGVRKRRFLHYKNSAGSSCSIGWTYRGEDQTAGLPDASARWLALDMESLNGLWPGTYYSLSGALYALEDDEP